MRLDKHSKFWSDISNVKVVLNNDNKHNDHRDNRKNFFQETVSEKNK